MGQCGAGAEAGARAGLAPPAPVRRDDVVRHREHTGERRRSGLRAKGREEDARYILGRVRKENQKLRVYIYGLAGFGR